MNEDAKVHEAAQRLGAAAAEKLDVEQIAARVVQRLRSAPAAAARCSSSWVAASCCGKCGVQWCHMVRTSSPTTSPISPPISCKMC